MEQQTRKLGGIEAIKYSFQNTTGKPEDEPKPKQETFSYKEIHGDEWTRIRYMKPFERRIEYEALVSKQRLLVKKVQQLAALPDTKDFNYMVHRMKDISKYICQIEAIQKKKQPFDDYRKEQRGY